MGWFRQLLGKEHPTSTGFRGSLGEPDGRRSEGDLTVAPTSSPSAASPSSAPPRQVSYVADGGGYAVVDLETTGLSPRQHRALDLAVVLVDRHGTVQHEWSTLLNPQGPVGASHIHGIRDSDVAGAPTFDGVLPQLAQLLAGRALVGHNVSFDAGFLRSEFARAGWDWPAVPMLCTMKESFHFLPTLGRRRLTDCCWASGIRLTDAHSALGDARATATLLASYLDHGAGVPPLPEHRGIVNTASIVRWPSGPRTGYVADPAAAGRALTPRARRVIAAASADRTSTLVESFTLADALDDGAPRGTLSYLETLTEVLEDGQVSEAERAALVDVAGLYDLTDRDVRAAHRGFVRALAREALEDGVLARAEKAEIQHIADMLDVPRADLKGLLDGEEEARLAALSAGLAPLPGTWSNGEPLRVGQRVAFTGCDDDERAALERRAQERGVRVTSSVSRRTAMLVTDGSFSGTKAAAAVELGVRQVSPTEFATFLDHVQAAVEPRRGPRSSGGTVEPSEELGGSRPSGSDATLPTSEPAGVVLQGDPVMAGASGPSRPSAAAVRTWARAHGHDVGVRGRLAAEVWDAYEAYEAAQM